MIRLIFMSLIVLCSDVSNAMDIQVFMRQGQLCSSCSMYNVKPIIIGKQKQIVKKINRQIASESHPDTKNIVAEYMPQLKAAYKNIASAYRVGVTKIPAVVIDHKYIVYGITNIPKAIELYKGAKVQGQKNETN